MRRSPKPRFLADGVLVVDKPAGPTSHDVVDRLRRVFRPAKLGHGGTLDPFATGVLVLAFNQATRLSELLGAGAKVYRTTLALGRATDTGDLTGRTVEEGPALEPGPDEARAALEALRGERRQAPPSFSAAKHQGRPLYAYARAGVEVAKPARPITVHEVELMGVGPGWMEFIVVCSRGTYVRALGEELARALGTVGHLSALRRLASRPFLAEDAAGLETALAWSPEELRERLTPPAQALARCGVPAAAVDEETVWQVRRGRILPGEAFLARLPAGAAEGPFMVLSPSGELAAVLRWLAPGQRRPGRDYETIRVFPEASGEGSELEASASASGAE